MINYTAFLLSPIVVEFIIVLVHKQSVNLVPKLRKRYTLIMGMILFFMIGFISENVGSGDSNFYVKNWELLRRTPPNYLFYTISNIDIEIGFELWVWASAHIFKWHQFFFILYGLLVSFTFSRFLYLNVEDLCLGFIMFSTLGLFGFLVQGIRQGIAICLCVLAIEECKKRRIIPFLILIGIGFTFHATSIIFLPVYFLPLLKLDLKSISIFTIVSILAVFFINQIFLIINTAINDSYEIGNTDKTKGGIISLLIFFMIIAFSLIVPKINKHYNLFFYMTLCALISFIMRYNINSIAQRISYFFMVGEIVLLSGAITVFEKRQYIIMRLIIIVLCLGIAFYKSSYSVIIPYLFFWQG